MKNSPEQTKKSARFIVILFILMGILTLLIFLSLITGSVNILKISNSELSRNILLRNRLPETITALLAGASLAACGLILQSWFRNPLAGPSILGISSGAGLGIALAVMGGSLFFTSPQSDHFLLGLLQGATKGASALAGAVMVIIPILIIASRYRSSTLLLLFGILISYLINAFISILIHFSSAEQVKNYINWTFGSFSSVRLEQLPLFSALIVFALTMALFLTPGLNQLQLGKKYAVSMGLNLRLFQFCALALVSIITAIITLYCGPIAFIGISAPHFSRELLRLSDHRKLLPTTLLSGAILALTAAILSRAPGSSGTLPLNALLAIIGVPAVLTVLLRPQKGGNRL